MVWVALGCVDLSWFVVFSWVAMGWDGMGSAALPWAGLGSVGLSWVGLGCAGLSWIALG